MILILMVEGARAVISFCTPTPSCPEAPPCTPVSLTACRRRSPPSLPPPSRSRSSLPQRESTLSGSVDPSWLPCPPSNRCGSPSRSTTSAAHPLSTASASKFKSASKHFSAITIFYIPLYASVKIEQLSSLVGEPIRKTTLLLINFCCYTNRNLI